MRRRRRHLDYRPAQQIIEAPIGKDDAVVFEQRSIELAMFFSPDAAHLEDVGKIGIEPELDRQLDFGAVEIKKGEAVEKNLGAEQLLAADVDGVFREIEGLAQRGPSCSKLNLRNEGFFCAGGEYDGVTSIDVELEMTQKSRVVVEEPHIRCSRRSNVPGRVGGKKRLPVDEGQVIALVVRLQALHGLFGL